MSKHTLSSLLAIFALLASCALVVPEVGAQTANAPVQQSFSLTSSGQRLPTLTFTGPMATCAIVIYNSGGGFTLVPQVASDAVNNPTPTWVTASSVGGGSISSASTFVGNITGSGTTAFGGVLSSLTSGTVSGVESCTAAGSGSVAVASLPPVAIASLPPISGNVGTCASGGVAPCEVPTSAPPQAGWTPGPTFHQDLSQTLCNFLPAANTAASASGASQMVGCGGGTNGATLDTVVCNGTAINGGTACAKTQTPVDATTASTSLEVQSFQSIWNNGAAQWDRSRSAPSPAPSGVPASIYSTSAQTGAGAPIFCPNQLGGNGTTDALTQIIALSGTTHIYVCSYTISVEGTAAGRFGLVSGTGTNCATPVNNGPTVTFGGVSGATSSLSGGTGIGVVFDGGAGNALCIGGTGTSALYNYSITYTQF